MPVSSVMRRNASSPIHVLARRAPVWEDRRESAASTFPAGLVLRSDSDTHLHVIRVGLNYRFATGNASGSASH